MKSVRCKICGADVLDGFLENHEKEYHPQDKKGLKFDGRDNDGTEMKLRYDLIPWECIEELADIYRYGAKKYSADSWQQVGDFNNRYFAALMRHLIAWRQGEVCDQESAHRHLSHALWNVVALLWKELHSNEKLVEGSCMTSEDYMAHINKK